MNDEKKNGKMDVFGVGNAIVDTVAFVDDDFVREHELTKGCMTLVDAEKQAQLLHALRHHKLEMSSGGSAANTMIGLARCGGTGFYTGKVSRDPNGEFYRQDLLEAGIHFDVNPAPEKELPTGTCLVFTTPDAERTMYTHLGVSTQLDASDIEAERVALCQYAYLEGYLWTGPNTKAAALAAMKEANHHHVPVAFSFSDPGLVAGMRDDFRALVTQYVDVVFCNADEARGFAGSDSLHDSARAIAKLVKLAFITDGARGALVAEGDSITEVAGFQVKAIDTNGAGDNFAAGVLFGLTHGFSPAKSARLGNYLASRVVQVHGARIEESIANQLDEILG